jgi:thioesterase domain-containing protein
VQSSGKKNPLYVVQASPRLRSLMLRMRDDRPLLVITEFDPAEFDQANPGQLPSLAQIASRQIQALRDAQPKGPYMLMGRCANGVLAYEMAQQLRAAGRDVPVVVMIDSFNPSRWRLASRWEAIRRKAQIRLSLLQFHLGNVARLSKGQKVDYMKERLESLKQRWLSKLDGDSDPADDAGQITLSAVRNYDPVVHDGSVILFRARNRAGGHHADAAHGWQRLVSQLEAVDVPGDHHNMLLEPNVGVIAAYLSARLGD